MTQTAIVYFARRAASVQYARWLSDRLAFLSRRAQLLTVANASAHEVVFFDVVVLIGPMRWGRMHGMAVAKAVAPMRPTAILVTGPAPAHRVLRLLPAAVRDEVAVFNLPAKAEEAASVNAAAEWVLAATPPRRGPPRTLSG
ncbi:hypothetical protein [Paeniglutamicibacter cryotolerans]|uniref:Uncharacterized protein n=1 Tax=Paeniglutamicibacter cryotolerans TaxID=670079 RepID=A0A839QKJ1_9MICC|nr:hypothetical protein [Paeniglutamicibacter cryotolerans]MBB2994546.1 hypothetical protein [Paeniglutamicibacter cryotolerans]